MDRFALVSGVHVFATGSYISGVLAMHVWHVVAPEVTSTFPPDSSVAVGYHRRLAMSGSRVHCSVAGLKMLACCRPGMPFASSCPPTMRTRPSPRLTCPDRPPALPVGTG